MEEESTTPLNSLVSFMTLKPAPMDVTANFGYQLDCFFLGPENCLGFLFTSWKKLGWAMKCGSLNEASLIVSVILILVLS